jgi:protein TonB
MKMDVLHNMRREFVLSLILHLCFFGAVAVFGHNLGRSRDAVLVYLTDELPGGGSGGSSGPATLSQGSAKPKAPRVRREPGERQAARSLSTARSPAKDLEKKPETKDQEISGRSETAADLAGISGGQSWQAGGGEGGSGTGGGAGFGPGAGGGAGSGYGQGAGNGRGLPNARMQYLKEHFAYIRDLIMKHLSYPQMARKMGWKGKVIVAFVIRENGTVENSRVVRSSGYDVLDHNTLKTIREAQPFPRPPVKAELVIPIVYKLE